VRASRNLVEALQWVMGETSARRLRGGDMDDVIFGGTSSRPARNVAAVALLVENDDSTATAILSDTALSDQAEIEIERRIDRAKGSNYRINGKEFRARDVQLLFADAASGAQSTALVGQGRIGALINAKPTERRHIPRGGRRHRRIASAPARGRAETIRRRDQSGAPSMMSGSLSTRADRPAAQAGEAGRTLPAG